jgi:hypothetical protein
MRTTARSRCRYCWYANGHHAPWCRRPLRRLHRTLYRAVRALAFVVGGLAAAFVLDRYIVLLGGLGIDFVLTIRPAPSAMYVKPEATKPLDDRLWYPPAINNEYCLDMPDPPGCVDDGIIGWLRRYQAEHIEFTTEGGRWKW